MQRRSLGGFICAMAAALVLPPLVRDASAVETVTVTGQRFSEDACLRIAKAKYAQWAQPRVMRAETDTFADGATKNNETIYTENTIYYGRNNIWRTGQIFMGQRTAESPAVIEKNMGLANCSSGEKVQESGKQTTIYSFSAGTSDDAASGRIWVSDVSGLPLREEMQLSSKGPKLPISVVAFYSYGDDVQIPRPAELAESVRLTRTACTVRELQNPALHGGC